MQEQPNKQEIVTSEELEARFVCLSQELSYKLDYIFHQISFIGLSLTGLASMILSAITIPWSIINIFGNIMTIAIISALLFDLFKKDRSPISFLFSPVKFYKGEEIKFKVSSLEQEKREQ